MLLWGEVGVPPFVFEALTQHTQLAKQTALLLLPLKCS